MAESRLDGQKTKLKQYNYSWSYTTVYNITTTIRSRERGHPANNLLTKKQINKKTRQPRNRQYSKDKTSIFIQIMYLSLNIQSEVLL